MSDKQPDKIEQRSATAAALAALGGGAAGAANALTQQALGKLTGKGKPKKK